MNILLAMNSLFIRIITIIYKNLRLNFGETITYANVIKGMEILTAKNSSATGLYKEGEASEAKKVYLFIHI